MWRQASALIVVTTMVLLAGGCAGKGAGGGFLPSAADDGTKATFGFRYNTLDSEKGNFGANGVYHDKSAAGVKLEVTGILFVPDPPEVDPQCVWSTLGYESQDPKNRGTGLLEVEVCDKGKPGPGNGDYIAVDILTGPFGGYSNSGVIQGGNIHLKDPK